MATLTEPRIVERDEQPYTGIRTSVTMRGISGFIDDSFPKVFVGIDAAGVKPSGAPFVHFNVVDMERELEIEVGLPVASPLHADGRVFAGVVPAGRYGSLTYVGPYDGLIDANEALLPMIRSFLYAPLPGEG